MKTKFFLLLFSFYPISVSFSLFIAINRILNPTVVLLKSKKKTNIKTLTKTIECWHKYKTKTGSSSPEKDLTNGYHTQQMTKSKRFGKDI